MGDNVNLQQMFTGDYDGKIPQNENEIAVEQSLIEKNNLNWKIGDTVKIPIGYRYYTDAETGEQVRIISGSYTPSEKFELTEKKSIQSPPFCITILPQREFAVLSEALIRVN